MLLFLLSLSVVLDWQKRFEDKLSHLFCPRERLGDEEAENMGRRHSQQEVEKFVTANTRELDKEKWLCVLCGKMFKVCVCVCVCV